MFVAMWFRGGKVYKRWISMPKFQNHGLPKNTYILQILYKYCVRHMCWGGPHSRIWFLVSLTTFGASQKQIISECMSGALLMSPGMCASPPPPPAHPPTHPLTSPSHPTPFTWPPYTRFPLFLNELKYQAMCERIVRLR